jgi:hypothetical protein
MACCGQRRGAIDTSGTAASARRPPPTPRVVLYQYTGPTAMTVAGPMSGATYRFGAPGAKVQIDMRDAPSMAALPNLRRLE